MGLKPWSMMQAMIVAQSLPPQSFCQPDLYIMNRKKVQSVAPKNQSYRACLNALLEGGRTPGQAGVPCSAGARRQPDSGKA